MVVEFKKGTDAKEFFYELGERMGYSPRMGKGHYPPGTGLDWALARLGQKRAPKLTRAAPVPKRSPTKTPTRARASCT